MKFPLLIATMYIIRFSCSISNSLSHNCSVWCTVTAGLSPVTQEEVDKFIEESLKMKEFHHRHVMGLHGICLHEPSSPMIIMPFMSNGDLLSYLRSRRQQWEQLDRNTVRNTILSSAVPVACYIAKYNFLLHSPTAACCYEIYCFL